MIINHLKISLRKIINDRIFSIIKVLSLAISIASSILIFMWVSHELSFDRFHPGFKRSYRVLQEFVEDGESTVFAPVCGPAGEAIKDRFPQVEYSARVYVQGNWLFRYEENKFYENRVVFSEQDLLKIFHIPLIRGRPDDALIRPNTMLITESAAVKYFGDDDPIGKSIKTSDDEFQITGIVKDSFDNSILEYDFIVSLSTWADWDQLNNNWFNTMFFTYIKLKPEINAQRFEAALDSLAYNYVGDIMRSSEFGMRFHIEPLSDVHLNNAYRLDEDIHGSRVYIFIFSIIGIFILIIGSINYMNLSTSRNMDNFKEIAVRRIVGGTRGRIISFFLTESVIISFIALILGLFLVELFQGSFNKMVGKEMGINYLSEWWILPGLLLIGILIGFLSGIYPSMHYSRVSPINIFRNDSSKGSAGSVIRKGLVIIQFSISIVLIIASLIIYLQLDYMKNKNLGFTLSNKIAIPMRGGINIEQNYGQYKSEFLSNPDIIDISASSTSIGKDLESYTVQIANSEDDKRSQAMYHLFIDDSFITQFEIELLAGRNFDGRIKTDISSWDLNGNGSIIINESAMRSFGWSSPEKAIGNQIITGLGSRRLSIIGVVADFHLKGLQNSIEPLILEFFPDKFAILNVTVNESDVKSSLGSVEKKWVELFPENPFEYYFIATDFNQQYAEETKTGRVVSLFTVFGIIVACLGLYGLTLFTAERRKKEIGIRKAMGATVSNIIINLSSGFLWLVVISNLIAWPLVFFFMKRWLSGFSYRIDMPYWSYFLAGIITLIIAQITLSLHAVYAANRNPIEALSYD